MNTSFLSKAFDEFLRGKPADSFPGCCYPRRILPPNGYTNPKLYAVGMYGILRGCYDGTWGQHGIGKADGGYDPDACAALLMQRLVYLKTPTFFVAEQFLRAVAATEPPPDLTLEALHWPMEALLFVLPLPFMLQYTGGFNVPFLSIGLGNPGEYLVGRKTFVNNVSRVMFHFPVIGNTGLGYDYTGAYSLSKPLKDIEEAPFVDGLTDSNFEEVKKQVADPQLSQVTKEQELALNKKMNSLAIKLLLVMAARQELTEYGSEARPRKEFKHGPPQEALWHPNMLGRQYRVVTEGLGGQHASPRMHWRRGHMRQQKFGRGWQQTRLIWIDPVLVNAEKEEAS